MTFSHMVGPRFNGREARLWYHDVEKKGEFQMVLDLSIEKRGDGDGDV